MQLAIALVQLVDIPNLYPTGTIVEVFDTIKQDNFLGGDLTMFIPLKIGSNSHTFDEMKALIYVKGINLSEAGISKDEIANRRNVLANAVIEQRKRTVISKNQAIPPQWHRVIKIDDPNILFDTGFVPQELKCLE